MKYTCAIALALLTGVVIGNFLHPVSSRAEGPTTIYIDQLIASGTKQSHTITGNQVVGFSCGPGMTGTGTDCYALSIK
jgi:hypothetical protein